jgi:Uncharacterized enzyme of heme biosynthesis
MQYCAVCLIARDENAYIREWAEYHLRIGFDAVILYDNESTTPLADELTDLAALGRVLAHTIPSDPEGWIKTQGNAYTDCMERYRDAFRWIAVIDSDEFLVPKHTRNIKEFLGEYECYGAVVANWVMFGSSGVAVNESGSQIFTFIHTADEEKTTIKSIVQPRKVLAFTGPHGADLLPGHFAVSADHFPLEPCVYSAPFTGDRIQLNHYWWRSREDYQAKTALKNKNGRGYLTLSHEEEQARHPRKNLDIVKLYGTLRETPIGPYAPPRIPGTVGEMVESAMEILEAGDYTALEIYLCHASLAFENEALVWMLRSVAARARNNTDRALHCIREASKLSGASTIYYELARVYAQKGDALAASRAQAQAEFKKRVEDTTCA